MRAVNNAGSRTDRGVTPVIGIILVVAIAVILSAIVGAYALDLGSGVQGSDGPDMQWSFDYDDGSSDNLTAEFQAGNDVDVAQLEVVVSGTSNDDDRVLVSDVCTGCGDPIEPGDTIELNSTFAGVDDGSLDLQGAVVRIVWTSETEGPNGRTTSVVAKWTGPS